MKWVKIVGKKGKLSLCDVGSYNIIVILAMQTMSASDLPFYLVKEMIGEPVLVYYLEFGC